MSRVFYSQFTKTWYYYVTSKENYIFFVVTPTVVKLMNKLLIYLPTELILFVADSFFNKFFMYKNLILITLTSEKAAVQNSD